MNKASWIVTGGKIQFINPPSGRGESGILTVQAGHAVVVEHLGKGIRVLGEGVHQLEPSETPTMVFPLFVQGSKLIVENVITKDGLVINRVDALVFHKIDPGTKNRDTASRYPFDENQIFAAWNPQGSNPVDSVKGISATTLRTVLSKYTVEELFIDHHSARQKLSEELAEETNRIILPFMGMKIIAATIDNVILSELIQEKLWRIWALQRKTEVPKKETGNEAYFTDNFTKPKLSNEIFIVHGSDGGAKESVARFVERLELQPIILHEQPNSGRTIIEKFEDYSNVGFSIILLTPDDVGSPHGKKDEIKPRARQNVIFELGYFMGKLGRGRVCALYKEEVEIPSDYQGILYVPMDSAGAWKMALAVEMNSARIKVDLNKMLS